MRVGLGIRESNEITVSLPPPTPSSLVWAWFFSDAGTNWKIISTHCPLLWTLCCTEASGALDSEEMVLLLIWTALVSQLILRGAFCDLWLLCVLCFKLLRPGSFCLALVNFCQVTSCVNYVSFLPHLDISTIREGPCLNIPLHLSTLEYSGSTCLMTWRKTKKLKKRKKLRWKQFYVPNKI